MYLPYHIHSPNPTPLKMKTKLTFDLNIRNAEAISLNGFIRMKPNGDLIGAGRHRKLGTYDAAMCGDRSCEA